MRMHRSTLLHYVSANGVEDFRQKTPINAVEVAEILLKANADVNAESEAYGGGSTTLGLVATSVHPEQAGVQIALLETLLQHGATIEAPTGKGNAVNGCLANGRGQAAEFLAMRGGRIDLEGAAGVGRIDLVKNFFNEDGSLKANATKAQMKSGFAWACEFGRTSVVDYMLMKGIHVDARLKHNGQTGLHWASYGGHADTVKLLLESKAPVDAKDESFEGTPLGWAIYGWGENPSRTNSNEYYRVVALLVRAGATVAPEWLSNPDREMPLVEKINADPLMLTALRGEMPSI